jgi:glutathione S-transferase
MKIDVDFEIFGILAFYSAILLGKMLLMSALTSRARIQKKVFANPEDKVFARGVEVSIKHTDQDVERIRRAHLNDMENILPFIPLAVLFAFSNPGTDCARCLFQIFTVARICHTIFYLVPRARKPWLRFASCAVGWFINVYMAYHVIAYNF